MIIENNELCQLNSTSLSPNETPPIEPSLINTTQNIEKPLVNEEKNENIKYPTPKDKKCTNCESVFPVSSFYKNKTKKCGYHTECKTCSIKREKEYRLTGSSKRKIKKQKVNPLNKKCNRCQQIMPITQFYPRRSREAGISAFHRFCKDCCKITKHDAGYSEQSKIWHKEYYVEHLPEIKTRIKEYLQRPEIIKMVREKSKIYREKNIELLMLRAAHDRCRKKHLKFNLQIEDIKVPDFCPVLGIPLLIGSTGFGGPTDNSPSLDRINNNLGYEKGNIIVVSNKVNRIKASYTADDIEKVGKFYLDIKNFNANDYEYWDNDEVIKKRIMLFKSCKTRAKKL